MFLRKLSYLLFTFIFVKITIFSQVLDPTKKNEDLLNQKTQDQSITMPQMDLSGNVLNLIEPSAGFINTNPIALEGAIDASKYIVGPNDIFSLGIWGVIGQSIPLQVSPEGTIIIPSVGEVLAAGLPLNVVKSNVISKVRTRYISGDITLTLTAPRRFAITVTGVGQGVYPITSVTRASALISYVFSDSISLVRSGTSPMEKGRFSVRNIKLTRKDGSVHRLDMHKYYATSDDKYNPYLLEGDVINIPKYDIDGKFISVYGSVQFPNIFEYVDGDDLETAIQLVRGFTTSANPDSILISRLDPTANKMNNFYVRYEDNKDMKMQLNDRVMIQSDVEQRRDYKVLVLGEVMRPGNYPISVNSTRLSEVIMHTGGFNDNYYLPTSEIYRKLDTLNLPNNKFNRDSTELIFTMRLNDVISNKEEKELFEQETKGRIGRINVDFERLFVKNDISQDITLRDGDIIYIGNNRNVVYVYGQVNTPGYVPFHTGKNTDFYIDGAGGLGERADEDGIRVIKFKTRQWIEPEEAKIEAGDFVYVPKVIKRDFAYDIDLIAKIASVVSSVITITLLIIQSQK